MTTRTGKGGCYRYMPARPKRVWDRLPARV
ncbi:hypothetical protein [Ciceribacter azotifigens]